MSTNAVATTTPKKGRRGFPVYDRNPFMAGVMVKTKKKNLTVARGTKLTDIETNEEEMTTTIAQIKHVDEEGFVKLFSGQVKLYFELSQPGLKVFLLMLQAVQKSIGADRIYMTHLTAMRAAENMGKTLSRAVYDRGVRDLCEKKIIAVSEEVGWFFINPAVLFNGDRARFVTEYRRTSQADQGELFDTPKSIEEMNASDGFEAWAGESETLPALNALKIENGGNQ
jgi:hypothetical protein